MPKRFRMQWISSCLTCDKQLTVSAVPFSGDIECPSCGAINLFRDAQQPLGVRGGCASDRIEGDEGREGKVRLATSTAA
jgi:predicted RNA-binding Zn-ribbon protein involved in translation (DUF1610 family)